MKLGDWIERSLGDMRRAIRTLARSPGFTATVVLTLAVGIGANSAVFSIVDAILLKPLPFPDADRLVRLSETEAEVQDRSVAPLRLEDWNAMNSTFTAITGYRVEDVSDTTGELAERVRRATVMPRFLEVWGIRPALGRDFTDAEHQWGAPPAVLISARYWQRRFAGNPNVLDRTVRLRDQTYAVVGVMPPVFRFLDRDVDIWVPHPVDAPFAQARQLPWNTTIGRLRSDVTLEQARTDLTLVQRRLSEQYPDTDAAIGVRIVPLIDSVVGGVRESLWLLFGAVSLLLLIACTNIAALLLARAVRREHEIAIRFSLGASHGAVIRLMLSEAILLSLAGAIVGFLVVVGVSMGVQALAADLPREDEIAVFSGRLFFYATASAVLVAAACTLFPAIRIRNQAHSLAAEGRGQVSSGHSLQWGLVGIQAALSVMLLVGAGLLLRSFDKLSGVNPGFDASGVLTFRLSGTYGEPGGYDGIIERINTTLDELNTIPGVDSSATALMLPGVTERNEAEFRVEGEASADVTLTAELRVVSPDYFQTLQIPLIAGELCRRPSDSQGSIQDVMVNRSFVDTHFSNRSPIGLHLSNPPFLTSGRIVGVVADARELGLDRQPASTVYSCFSAPIATPWFLVRTRGPASSAISSVRARLAEIEPTRAVYDFTALEQRIRNAYAQNRLRMILLVLFSATALSLTCLGIYGTLSYVASLRRREVGLRMALGALPRSIAKQFLFNVLRVVGLACLIGLGLSFVLTRLLSGMLYGVSPLDPATLSCVILLVLIVSTLAALFPAMRAARIAPMQALRQD